MSNSKSSQVSTKSASKVPHENINPFLKELITSCEGQAGKTDFSFDLNQSFKNQDSLSFKESIEKEQNFLSELEALNMSIIPNESSSASFIKASVLELHKNCNNKEESPIRLKPLVLETTEIKQKWWCQGCIMTESKTHSHCITM